MKNRFHEIHDLPDETGELNHDAGDPTSPDMVSSNAAVERTFVDCISDDELAELEASTAPDPDKSIQEIDPEYTEEELKQIWENDPGYLNENVIHTYATEIHTDDGPRIVSPSFAELFDEKGTLKEEFSQYGEFYRSTGLHRVSWNNDAVEGTKKEIDLEPGTVVDRWTVSEDAGGTYLAEEGTDFNDLHLNVSQDKRIKVQYEVLKPFRVMESVIADQPFDEDVPRKAAKQYKTAMDITDLVEMGYLKKMNKDDVN